MNAPVKIVKPSGILDSTKANQFRQEIISLVEQGIPIILVDFKNVTFMDSSGLGALVISLKTVRSAGAKLLLCSLNEQIKMLFELTSMNKVFDVFADKQEVEQKLINGEI